MPISLEKVVGLVKLAQKCSKINKQYEFWKKIDPAICAFLGANWCIVAFVILPMILNDSKLFCYISSKPLSQVVGKNLFGQLVCRMFFNF